MFSTALNIERNQIKSKRFAIPIVETFLKKLKLYQRFEI